MLHLAEAHGGGRSVLCDAAGRAAMNQWNFFLVTEIEQPLWRAGLHQVIYPENERSQSEIALAYRDCRRFLEPLEAQLQDRDYLVADEPICMCRLLFVIENMAWLRKSLICIRPV
ncbi:glutathione S-transferase family protein [Paracoccus rhizosphaerae]|uniref:Glutathione S-transferase family protein n=1 Tax=Paracoccus rhizosphaerae TaxID=1133347 RepID=A0ABV6CJR1_9RHOB|nr:hypothetical protein [Paracoccus rhizosphaerae]